MSGLTGVAQFTNRFAQNIMGYNQDKKNEAERVADKERELARQAQQDKNAQQTHDINYQADTLKLDEAKDARTDSVNQRNYSKTYNQIQYFKQMGDESGAIDAIVQGANSHSDLPYKINVERDVNGKVASRTDENGNTYYYQNIIDKDTGKIVRTDSVTYEQLMEGYNQLQNGEAIAAEKAAYEAEVAKQLRKDQSELSLYTAKKGVDVRADGIKAERDYNYKISEKGVDHDYAMRTLGVKNIYDLEKLAIQQGYRLEQLDRSTVNSIALATANSDIYSGGTPNVGGASWGSFDALIGPESNGQQLNSRGQPLTSSAGAIGIAQVMPETAKYVASKHGIAWDANKYKTDPNYNYNLGKLYYQEQLNKYGHPALAYAAYNAGPGAVDKWIKKNPAMRNPDAMGMQNFINAIPFSETKNYVAKIHRQSGGVQVQRSVPAAPKAAKSGSKKVESVTVTSTAKDYDAVITKGLSKTQKSLKSLGLKPDAASAAVLAETATLLRDMGKAGSAQEVSDIYGDVYLSAQKAIPASKLRQMTKAQRSALTNQIIYSIAGVSSAKEIRQAIERFNPAARSGGSVRAGGLTLPGRQARTQAPTRQTAQTSKLQALYSRGLTPPRTDPAAAESFDYMNNLNDNMDW